MKFLLGLGKMLLAAVLISTMTVFVTWTAVQTYLDKVLAHYQLGQGMGKIEFSDLLSEMASSLNIIKQPANVPTEGAGAKGPGQKDASAATGSGTGEVGQQGSATGVAGTGSYGQAADDHGEGGGANGTGTIGENGDGAEGASGHAPDEQGTQPGDAVPVFNQSGVRGSGQASSGISTSGSESESSAGKKLVISSEDFQNTKDKLTNEDKMKLFSLLISKLPEADLQTLSQLVEDGITSQELEQMDQIIQKSLSKEDYEQVLTILQKYK